MKYALLAGTCLFILVSTVFAGGTPDTDEESLQWLFEFNGLSRLELDTYAGGLGVRYFIDDDGLAGRISLNAAYRTDEEGDDKRTISLIGGSIIIEKFLNAQSSVAPYVGIGFGFFHSGDKKPTDEGELKTSTITMEVPAVAGFQWWFTDALALGGEYRWSVRYIKDTYELGGYSIGEHSTFKTGMYAASVFLSVNLR